MQLPPETMARLEYIFEKDEQDVPNTVSKEKVAESGRGFVKFLYL